MLDDTVKSIENQSTSNTSQADLDTLVPDHDQTATESSKPSPSKYLGDEILEASSDSNETETEISAETMGGALRLSKKPNLYVYKICA